MTFSDKDGGALFKNTKKEPGSQQPDYTGPAKLTCPFCQRKAEYRMAAWIREKDGMKYMSVNLQTKEEADGYANKSGVGSKPTSDF